MDKKIAILRGINVGGKRIIRMADLKLLAEKLGWKEVKTYIQSGNLIFNASQENTELEHILENAILEKFGFEVPVIIRDAAEFQSFVKQNPFLDSAAAINQLHLTFLKTKPAKEDVTTILSHNYAPDKFAVHHKEVFICCTGKYHQSKLTNIFFEKQLKTGATTRNWKTVLQLIELSKD